MEHYYSYYFVIKLCQGHRHSFIFVLFYYYYFFFFCRLKTIVSADFLDNFYTNTCYYYRLIISSRTHEAAIELKSTLGVIKCDAI